MEELLPWVACGWRATRQSPTAEPKLPNGRSLTAECNGPPSMEVSRLTQHLSKSRTTLVTIKMTTSSAFENFNAKQTPKPTAMRNGRSGFSKRPPTRNTTPIVASVQHHHVRLLYSDQLAREHASQHGFQPSEVHDDAHPDKAPRQARR